MKGKLLLLFFFVFISAKSQTYLMQNGSYTTCSGTFYDSGGAAANYSNNEDYEITFCPSTPGSYISLQFSAFNLELGNNLRDYMIIYNGTGTSGTIIGNYYNSSPLDCTGGTITSSDPSGCITVVFSSNNNNQRAGWEAAISCSSVPGNTGAPTNSVCSGANPFCADSGLQYPNLSNCDAVPDAPQVVTDNTCLTTAPNPAWYYLSIGIAGVIKLQIKQSTGPNNTGNGLDVDFAIWGPFPDSVSACNDFTQGDCNGDHNCSGNVVDCSYDPAPTENATIPNAQVGEVYMVLITNFDGDPGFITMEQTNVGLPGAGSTDCSIVCPTFTGINPTCGGSNGSIRVSGLGVNATHQITYLDDGVPVTISLTSNAIGQATISNLNAGNYTQLLTDIAGCTTPASVTLTSTVPTITSVTANSPVCSGSQVVFTITGTPNSYVTYNINNGANQTITLSPSGTRTVTVTSVTTTTTLTTVSVFTSATCIVPIVVTKTVTIIPAPSLTLTTAVNTSNQSVCENAPISIIKYTIGGSATGATVSGLPNGVAGTFASGVLTITGSPTQTGTFNYVVTTSGGCAPNATLNGTINVGILPAATISYPSTPYCKSLTTAQAVTRTGTSGGTYSATPAGLTIDPNTGAITPSTSTANIYTVTYTMAATGGCPVQTATAPVTITAILTATISYATPFCNSLTVAQAVTRTGTAGGTYSATPVGLTINPFSGAITPSTSLSNTYTITYTMAAAAGCAAQTTTTSVVITTLPAATISYPSTPYCKSLTTAHAVTRTGTSGGTYSATPAGLTIDPNTGAITPSTSTANIYTVTYTMAATGGCPVQTATAPVIITAIPTATISYATPFCNSLTTAQAVTRTGTAGGTYSATPVGLTINPFSGAITPSTSLSNTYTITYTMAAAAGCAVQTTTTSVVITTLPSATISYPSTPYCKSLTTAHAVTRTGTSGGTYSATPAGLTIDANTGAITPSTSTANTYTVTYTMAATGGCPVQTATAPVTITAIPVATISYATPFCNSLATAQAVTRTGTAGGTYSATPAGLTINPISGAITPNTSLSNTYTVTYTMAAVSGCAAQTTTTSVVITTLPTATISYPSTPYCKSLTTAQAVTRTGTSGGTYSAAPAGLTIDANTGAITPSTSTANTYTVTYTMAATGGCLVQTATTSVTITEIPTATISYPSNAYCNSEAVILNVTRVGTQGGTYSSVPVGLSINPNTGAIVPNASSAGSYQVVYTMPAAAGCAAQTTATSIVIKALPVVTASSQNVTICSGDTFSVSLSSSLPNTTFSWVRLASNVNGSHAGSGNVLSETLTTVNSSLGNVYYTVTPNSDGCDGLPIVLTVRVNPLPEPQPIDGVICLNNITNTLTRPFVLNTYLNDAIFDFVWSYNATVIPNATSSTYQATQAGTYEVVATNSFTGCVSAPVQANVTATYAAQSMTTYGYDAFTDNPMVIVNVNGTGNFMYQLDHGPVQYSNVFYNVSSGTHTVYVTDENGCTQLSEEILVIAYPKFFTPNNDGYNDTWNIDDLADQKQSIIYIFDRYGKLIKQISPWRIQDLNATRSFIFSITQI